MKKLKLLLLAPLLFTISCASSGGGKGVSIPKTTTPYTVFLKGEPIWKSMEDVRKDLGSKAKITGTTVDLMGGKISGSKLKQSSDQNSEDSIPLRVRIENFTLKNGVIQMLPGGIINLEKNSTYQNLVFIGIGQEDALSNIKDVSPGMKVINCKFYNNDKNDKAAQFNDGRGLLVRGGFFSGGITSIRIGESSSKNKGTARVENTTFENVSTALNVDGDMTVYTKGLTLKNVQKPYVVKSGSKLVEE